MLRRNQGVERQSAQPARSVALGGLLDDNAGGRPLMSAWGISPAKTGSAPLCRGRQQKSPGQPVRRQGGIRFDGPAALGAARHCRTSPRPATRLLLPVM